MRVKEVQSLKDHDAHRVSPHVSLALRISILRDFATAFLSQVDELLDSQDFNIEEGINLCGEVRRFEMELIKCALHCTGNNQAKAAKLLGVNATTLNYKIKVYKIPTKTVSDSQFKKPSSARLARQQQTRQEVKILDESVNKEMLARI